MSEPRTALLAGATGLIGGFLLQRLLDAPEYERVLAWGRRQPAREHPKLESAPVDFARLDWHRIEAEDVFCCLGTTIKQAGSQEAFRRVDYDYPVALAKAARRDGAKRFLVVSALGASSRSGVFYNRVKGDMEAAVKAAGVPQTSIFRPSLLAGRRENMRRGERIGEVVGNLLGPLLGKYRPIHGDLVAAAMLKAALQDLPGRTYESDQIRALAG
ncbi:MAG TPA: NAD(P)H-binding protein [Burkholderiales bacterium]|nr:NAD(P)H-binding protein [Burkholderiales bacterium]